MDLRRLRVGEWAAAAAGAVLVVSLFLPWYSVRGAVSADNGVRESAFLENGDVRTDFSAWEVLAVNDVLLALIGALGVALLFVTAAQSAPAVPIAFAALTTLAAMLGVLLVAFRLIWEPAVLDVPADFDPQREFGIFLALAAAIGLLVATAVAMRDERLSKPGRPTDATGVPIPSPAEIEAIPAPRP